MRAIALDDLDILHYFAGGVAMKQTHIPAGARLLQHVHTYDHLSYLVSGTVRLHVDGEVCEYTGPQALEIVAGKRHGVIAVTDAVWLCLHAIDDIALVDAVHVVPSSPDEVRAALSDLAAA